MSRIQIIERCNDCKYFENDPDIPQYWGVSVCKNPETSENGQLKVLENSDNIEIPDFCPLDKVVFDPDTGIPDSGQVFEVTED